MPSGSTFNLIESFLSELRSSHTKRAYRTDLKAFFRTVGCVPTQESLRTVERSDVDAFGRSLREKDLSTSTQRRRLSAVRGFFDWLLDRQILSTNPIRASSISVEAPSASSEEQKEPLDKKDIDHLLQQAGDDPKTGVRDRTLLLLILYGALRRGEVAALQFEDVRPLGRHWIIDLPTTSSTPGGYVKIPDRAANAVQALSAFYGEQSGPLWRSLSNRNRGAEMTPDAIYKRVRRLGESAGIPNLDIQRLRRSALRQASGTGAPLEQIQDQARVERASSATKYVEPSGRKSRLQSSAVDYMDFGGAHGSE